MADVTVGSYQADEIQAALLADERTLRFRYEVFTNNKDSRGFLAGVKNDGVVTYGFFSDTKRTLRFSVDESPRDVPDGWITAADVNFASDRVKPYWQILMPDGLYASFATGLFLLDSGSRGSGSGRVTREIAGYDLSLILRQDLLIQRHHVPAGTLIVDWITYLITSVGIEADIVPDDETNPSAIDFDPGTSRLTVINALLDSINYGSLYFDEDGVARARPYLPPSDRDIEITYATGDDSAVLEGASATFDLFEVPNVWTLVVSQPDRPMLFSIFTNSSIDSPTSTASRGREIQYFAQDDQSTSQAVLDAKVRRMAHEASQVYEEVEFFTVGMPQHGENNVLSLTHEALGLDAKYSETQWELHLKPGQGMRHSIRRVVDVG